MEKKIFWLVESNGDLSVTVQDLKEAGALIKGDFANEVEGEGEAVIDDLQYTITPKMMTQKEYEALPDAY